jgi:hypothetical protein
MEHTPKAIFSLCELAGAAYQTSDVISKKYGASAPKMLDDGFILSEGTSRTIAFRGTATEEEIPKNQTILLDDKLIFFLASGTHLGITKAILPVFELLTQEKGIEHYLLVGHSLGGSKALLLGAYLSAKGGCTVQVCTFGAPKVGDQNFAKWTENFRCFGVVIEGDIFPTLPQKPSYVPAGKTITLKKPPLCNWPVPVPEEGVFGISKKELQLHHMMSYYCACSREARKDS